MLKVEGLQAGYGTGRQRRMVVHDVGFEIPQGALFTLLGPSGCGKTTTLRLIAGLERPDAGHIEAHGVAVFSARRKVFVPPHRRGFGMVFQSYAIWPHLSVFQNAAFPLQVGGRHSRAEIAARVGRTLAAVGLEAEAGRPATQLSGGQQQRLALARALVMEPRLLLLDEPLSNLDATLRKTMRFELKRLQTELGITTLYVTHDQDEALALSDQVAVMDRGRIVQQAAPQTIYGAPACRFVAGFVGSTNFVDGRVCDSDPGRGPLRVDAAIGPVWATPSPRRRPGEAVTLSIRPEDISLLQQPPPNTANLFQGTVRARVFLGPVQDVQVEICGHMLHARLHPAQDPAIGQTVHLAVRPERCLVLDRAA